MQVLRDTGADVLVSYLPVGSEDADRFYAQAALDAGVAFVNALPVFIASDPEWAEKFRAAGVPIVGDDIKSQVGATITHRVLAKLFEDRGVQLDRTMQLNVGGNMDFLNMKELERLESKKVSKTQAVTSQVDRDMGKGNVHIGPSDYVSWLDDRKWAYVRLEGRAFGDVPLNLEYKLEVWDSRTPRASSSTRCGRPRSPRTAASADDPVGVELLHEVAAGAVPRLRGARQGRGVHPGRDRQLIRFSVQRPGDDRAGHPRAVAVPETFRKTTLPIRNVLVIRRERSHAMNVLCVIIRAISVRNVRSGLCDHRPSGVRGAGSPPGDDAGGS